MNSMNFARIFVTILTFQLVVADSKQIINTENFERQFYQEFQKYMNDSALSQELNDLLSVVTGKNRPISLEEYPNVSNPQKCLKCRLTSYVVINFHRLDYNETFIKKSAEQLCNLTEMAVPTVCSGYINNSYPGVRYILQERPDFTSEDFCSRYYIDDGCGKLFKAELRIKIDPNKPQIEPQRTGSSETPYKILHLTDPHYDPFYEPGSNAKCGRSCCCQKENGKPTNPKDKAGYWGDYRSCDSPWHAVIDVIETGKKFNPDFIYFTGDVVNHADWATSTSKNSKAFSELFDYLNQTFEDVPLYPILGNHEGHPSHWFAPLNLPDREMGTRWLYNLSYEKWQRWLPEETKDTILKGGYYTVLAKPGFRIIALNSNVCLDYNFWNLLDPYFYSEQLQWLHDTLLEAEKAGERVHILSHVPLNDHGCYPSWTLPFQKIVERFSDTITAQFNGHSHYDEINLFYDPTNTSKAINVAWNGGAGTAFSNLNPNYKTFKVDRLNLTVVEAITYAYNLTEANEHPDSPPRWFQSYSFHDFYDIPDLTFESLNSLVDRFADDKQLLVKYWQKKFKDAEPRVGRGCSTTCLASHLCDIVWTDASAQRKCNELKGKFLSKFGSTSVS